MLLSAKSLGLTIGQLLFSDLSFTLNPGDILGLIAANGRGKSSLLRCLAGQAEPTAGEITRARGATIALAEQDPSDLGATFRDTVLQGLADPEGEFWRADILLDELEVPQGFRDLPLGQLSGGWQRTALLARAAVSEPSVLLLDEPTNHLDLSRIALLQRWLKGRTVIVASHDRAFLDAVTTRSLFLRASESRLFALPYTPARLALAEADAARDRQHSNDLAKADQLRRQAAKLKNIGINSGSDLLVVKTKQLKERAEKIEAEARPAHREGSAGAIKLNPTGSHAKALVSLMDAEIRGEKPLYRTGTLWIEPGDRVVILGANGTGKSRLVARVLAAIQAPDPSIKVTPSLVLGHSGQGLEQLPPKSTPFDLVMAHRTGDGPARSLLAEAGIRTDMQTKPLGLLSGGQRARLAMLLLRLTAPNFYLLDEPTNHLDIEGQEALEAELLKPQAACLLVSHDRAFVRVVGNRFWEIRGKKLVEVDGPEAFFAAQTG
ncbi:ABC-F family ATP-binding cassette domain-containing protein [Stagnihabitans tardus]|uniref:ATP-binding cassette domain-containing protein n=1 Tax=Stagnihabitans tardus TaxID=2699202 RepID=A0AAE5BTI9_9RHOB|nr:ABC-F family ATP-binding cassette domain-containing protein [Stagnihabitans tardus]NBZ89075.1 ATP-binding cassette domain-containing protein [Stagnihabitans tardus]